MRPVDSLLIPIHMLNALWIVRIFWLRWMSGVAEMNYLKDVPLCFLLLSCAFLHLWRWRLIAGESDEKVYASSIELRRDIRGVAAAMYAAVPYLVPLVPNDEVLSAHAEKKINLLKSIEIHKKSDLIFHLFEVEWFLGVHFLMLVLALFGLYSGGLPSFASALSRIWFISPLMNAVGAGLLIQGAATMLFVIVFGRLRR
ncbi:MAG: hypothetical protein KF796_05935 [Ramlibacter sp.]|nr:hypothetical protein [Ramlibacter sp.]